jgi:small subunit ribosomal protein S8
MSVVTDPIADFLTRLRNAGQAGHEAVRSPYSKVRAEIAQVLKKEGYIIDYEVDTKGRHPEIEVKQKYVNEKPAITGLKRVSRPGLRRYVGADEIPRVLGGMGIAILSTSRGLLTDRQARKDRVGGELLAYVW